LLIIKIKKKNTPPRADIWQAWAFVPFAV